MRMIGEHIVSSEVRNDPVLSVEKEKEGQFDMVREEAFIAQQMVAMNQAMGIAPQPEQ